MSGFRRVVLDTSTLVGAVLRPESPPHRVSQRVLERAEVCVSAATLAALERVLRRGKFDSYLDLETRTGFVALLRNEAMSFPVLESDDSSVIGSCRDPGDALFLALALVAEADVIVSSDDDLLVLNPWRKIGILSPDDFLAAVDAGSDAKGVK